MKNTEEWHGRAIENIKNAVKSTMSQADNISNMIPDIIKQTHGGEKWNVKIAYEDKNNWLALKDFGKEVDVIYFYPTVFTKVKAEDPNVADIDDLRMRIGGKKVFNLQATIFEEDCNIYAPFYRQVSAPYALTLSKKDADELLFYSASKDPFDALDYYFENYNKGKPFILAGHSQGGQIVTIILSDYMKKHPEYYQRMVVAYAIGYSVTESYLKENPHLKFATGRDDTGVIVSFNTEGPGNANQHNAVVLEGAISINPINWKRDETYASAAENLGSIDAKGNLTDGFADARLDVKRGVVICESVDPKEYAIVPPGTKLFGPQSYHNDDFGFYFMNLRENAKVRIAAFRK